MSDSSQPHGLQSTRLLRPWDFPGKSTGVGCHCLLQICMSPFLFVFCILFQFWFSVGQWFQFTYLHIYAAKEEQERCFIGRFQIQTMKTLNFFKATFNIYFYLFINWLCRVLVSRHMGPSFLTRGGTQAPCIGSMES